MKTMKIGYCRVSSEDQDNAIQREKLREAGCTVIREEKVSGTSMAAREELADILTFIRQGDTLVVVRIDRLARDIGDLVATVKALEAKGASLQATEQPIDTSTASGKAFLQMLGVFAEFETNLRRERQLAGIAKAKAAGIYAGKGRPKSVDADAIAKLKAEGLGATAIAKRLGVSRVTVYRHLA